MPAALAFHYARALADLVDRPESKVGPEAVLGQLQAFENALGESPGLRIALESPAVTPARKRAVIARLAPVLGISDLARRFLLVVTDHRRVALVGEIREALESVLDERRGVVRVDVSSARELSPAQRQELTERLSRLTGKRTRARFSIVHELIGGVVARIGSTVYDGSIRGQLEALKQKMAGVEG